MQPQDLSDEQLGLVHSGAEPVYGRDKTKYYGLVCEGIAPWSQATNHGLRELIQSAQRKVQRGFRCTASDGDI
jgi:hypothetical protein